MLPDEERVIHNGTDCGTRLINVTLREYVFDVAVTKQMRVWITAPDTPEGRIEAEKDAIAEVGVSGDVVGASVAPVDACSGREKYEHC